MRRWGWNKVGWISDIVPFAYSVSGLSWLASLTVICRDVSNHVKCDRIAPETHKCRFMHHLFLTQVVRTSGVEVGTLLYKLDETGDDSPSTNHTIRWMVAFQGDDTTSSDEEEVSEKYIGRLVETSSNESDSAKSSSSKSKKTKTVPASAKRIKGKNGRFLPNPRPSKKTANDETVVKVKMLTGTLYLYRGKNPRAEFVRSV